MDQNLDIHFFQYLMKFKMTGLWAVTSTLKHYITLMPYYYNFFYFESASSMLFETKVKVEIFLIDYVIFMESFDYSIHRGKELDLNMLL